MDLGPPSWGTVCKFPVCLKQQLKAFSKCQISHPWLKGYNMSILKDISYVICFQNSSSTEPDVMSISIYIIPDRSVHCLKW